MFGTYAARSFNQLLILNDADLSWSENSVFDQITSVDDLPNRVGLKFGIFIGEKGFVEVWVELFPLWVVFRHIKLP
jgi:hypothetical protein